MTIRDRVCAVVFAMVAMGVTGTGYAATVGSSVPVPAMLGHEGHVKTVHFNVQNSSAAPLMLRCGEQSMTVAAGKQLQLKLPVGSKVLFAEASGTHTAGEMLAEVSTTLNGTTLNVH